MNGFDDRPKSWNADLSPSKTSNQGDLGTTMNAISFGFVATAILISMFLIMAIFEYLLRPKPSNTDQEMQQQTTAQLRSPGKLSNLKDVSNSSISVNLVNLDLNRAQIIYVWFESNR